MKINFNIFKGNISWNALIHQLNGDVLLRHVSMKGNLDSRNVDFAYCDETCQGKILNDENKLIGNFSVSY
ncbi:hypothetical protein GCM10007978_16710 [Shewanella hanedai]|jgi:hypothetical protein|uniref:Uncharacterized protein n=1 Tax=Shewanella hanedai TaxID=25 RepID=A0A553JSQ3_SHEHA|nr:hypothetical protein [Shewanella hanedai]TRY15411.1 hypothetical protein FN961_04940 [Shewanella hanedai]GGI79546.1 hypothetical protein GCM10007978_16710 [Shewanella hanedai]